MINSYLNLAMRTFARERSYAAINILGLSLGLACFLIIGLYLKMELTYDRHNLKHDRIYRVAETYRNSTRTDSINTGGGFGPLLEREVADVQASVRFREFAFGEEDFLFEHGDVGFYEKELLYADNSVFEVFTFEVLEGDRETALLEPGSIAISKSMAERYFNDGSALGRFLESESANYRVTLVFKDLPQSTHLKFDALISLSTFGNIDPRELVSLRGNQYYTYVLMSPGYDPGQFSSVSDRIVAGYGEQLGFADSLGYFLEPIAEIHLNSKINQGGRPHGNWFTVLTFAFTAFFILVIACINYINLATARSLKRAKEIGVKKVLGAPRSALVRQFLGESLVYTTSAFIVGICVAELSLSFSPMERLLGYDLTLLDMTSPVWLIGVLPAILLLGLAAGLYPAFYLASIRPMSSLDDSRAPDSSGSRIRMSLVLLQFIISISIIASTQLMNSQLNYVNGFSLGFSKDETLLLPLHGTESIENARQILNELVSSPYVDSASIVSSSSVPGSRVTEGWLAASLGQSVESARMVDRVHVDANFLPLLDISIVEGRNFSDEFTTDRENAVIVNQAAVEQLGWGSPVGRRIWIGEPQIEQRTIIGVAQDFHTLGLQRAVEPLLVTLASVDFSSLPESVRPGVTRTLLIGYNDETVAETLRFLESRWPEINPAQPFEYQFLDENIDEMYLAEGRQMSLAATFSLICILISCLGLLGLSSFTTQLRTKEIGIRKVLGATINNIVLMLFKGTFYLMLIASAIASILAYIVVSRWLEGFYYQVDIDPLIFVQSTFIALAIAFITMATQSWRVASQNPVEALRYE